MQVVEWICQIFDGRRYLCFGEKFTHPRDLIPFMSDASLQSEIDGFAADNPVIVRPN